MRCLYENLTREEADAYGLVLSASGVTHIRVHGGKDRWSLWVETADHDGARRRIEGFRRENTVEPAPAIREGPALIKTYSAVWVCLVLLAAFLATGEGADRQALIAAAGASAGKILGGEVYRAATALMLHATAAHLAGNVVGIALFGTAACSIAGPGAGWLMILSAGILGNIANAFLFKAGHLSIGASTAVFGAVGWLSTYQFYRKTEIPDRRIKAWLPLAGGIALLGFLGAGQHSDLTAHLFGFAAGLILGLTYARWVKFPLKDKYQALCLAGTIGLMAGAWFWAYVSG